MAVGDVLFYKADRSNLTDDIIALYEGSINDYVHCAIQVSETQKVEAVYPNIIIDAIDERHIAYRYSPNADEHLMQSALQTVLSTVNQPYGVGDILDVLLHHPIFETHTDCSDLATRYLYWCGIIPIITWGINPHIVTPAALAYRLGIPESDQSEKFTWSDAVKDKS